MSKSSATTSPPADSIRLRAGDNYQALPRSVWYFCSPSAALPRHTVDTSPAPVTRLRPMSWQARRCDPRPPHNARRRPSPENAWLIPRRVVAEQLNNRLPQPRHLLFGRSPCRYAFLIPLEQLDQRVRQFKLYISRELIKSAVSRQHVRHFGRRNEVRPMDRRVVPNNLSSDEFSKVLQWSTVEGGVVALHECDRRGESIVCKVHSSPPSKMETEFGQIHDSSPCRSEREVLTVLPLRTIRIQRHSRSPREAIINGAFLDNSIVLSPGTLGIAHRRA